MNVVKEGIAKLAYIIYPDGTLVEFNEIEVIIFENRIVHMRKQNEVDLMIDMSRAEIVWDIMESSPLATVKPLSMVREPKEPTDG